MAYIRFGLSRYLKVTDEQNEIWHKLSKELKPKYARLIYMSRLMESITTPLGVVNG